MSSGIRIGDRGRTRGPLKPAGQIRTGDKMLDAVSSGEWIDSDTEVEIIGGNEDRVLVQPVLSNQPQLTNQGQPLVAQQKETPQPLKAPPAWVERIDPVRLGVIAGAIIGLFVWIRGVPLSPASLSVPVAGGISGWVFRRLVAIPAEAVGPRTDHRPFAIAIAFGVCIFAMLGAIIGLDVSGTFLGTGLGLVIGTVVAGLVLLALVVFSHL